MSTTQPVPFERFLKAKKILEVL